ncbi:MAG: Fe-S-containing protein, partial [Chloroflexota bacterium]
LVLLAAWERRRHRPALEGFNPAQRRKLRAGYRQRGALLTATVFLLSLVILAEGGAAILTNRSLELSPAEPVTAQEGRVAILVSSLGDGKLHRFSYQTSGGTAVRFLAVHKGSGVYGLGLDACEFCGVAGYRQEGKDVICNRCGAAINIVTMGFPGGCNPIPLDGGPEGDNLVIPVEALEKAGKVFAR